MNENFWHTAVKFKMSLRTLIHFGSELFFREIRDTFCRKPPRGSSLRWHHWVITDHSGGDWLGLLEEVLGLRVAVPGLAH